MRIRLTIPEEHVSPEVINPVLEAVTRLDEHLIRTGQSPTSTELVQMGAKWHPEAPGDEHFDHGGTIAARGHGDCDDWGPLDAATKRVTGEDPGATAVIIPTGPGLWHAAVKSSDGRVITGEEDISVRAGMPMPKHAVVGGVETIQVYACDPHDGRIYTGALLPTTGPLALHCGPQVAVRGIEVCGELSYQGRCDMPLAGSPLVGVRARRHHHVRGASLPYALSCTSMADDPMVALHNAITGAILCGDAAEIVPNLDRYKLLAMQMGMAGTDPATVRETIEAMMAHDIEAAEAQTGIPGHAHVDMLRAQLAAHGVHVSGSYVDGFNLGDIGKIASGIVHVVSPVVNDVMKVARPIVNLVPWGDIVHSAEAAVSVIPGLGTAISDVIAYGETAVNAVDAVLSGSPLKFAVEAAYNFATASIPGAAAIRLILDPYVRRLLDVAMSKALIESGELDKMLSGVPDKPKIGSVSPRTILASLAHLVVGHLGMKNTSGKPTPKPSPAPLHTVPAPAPVVKPVGVPHAAVHVDAPVPMSNAPAPHPGAPAPVVPAGATHVTTTPHGAFHWHCEPGAAGRYSCTWLAANVSGAVHPGAPHPGGGMSAAQRAHLTMAQRFPHLKPTGPTGRAGHPAAHAAPPPGGGAPAPGASPSGGGGGGGGSDDGGPPPGQDGGYDPSQDASPPDDGGGVYDPSQYAPDDGGGYEEASP